MPGLSKNQVTAMRIAEHSPDKLYARNRGMLKMGKSQLHDFAVTPTANLPTTVGKKKKKWFPGMKAKKTPDAFFGER